MARFDIQNSSYFKLSNNHKISLILKVLRKKMTNRIISKTEWKLRGSTSYEDRTDFSLCWPCYQRNSTRPSLAARNQGATLLQKYGIQTKEFAMYQLCLISVYSWIQVLNQIVAYVLHFFRLCAPNFLTWMWRLRRYEANFRQKFQNCLKLPLLNTRIYIVMY